MKILSYFYPYKKGNPRSHYLWFTCGHVGSKHMIDFSYLPHHRPKKGWILLSFIFWCLVVLCPFIVSMPARFIWKTASSALAVITQSQFFFIFVNIYRGLGWQEHTENYNLNSAHFIKPYYRNQSKDISVIISSMGF